MIRIVIPILILALLAACLPNPEGPALEPPGAPPSEFVSNFSSIQINGDFSGINWDPADLRHYLKLEADYRWAIWVSVLESDYTDGNIHFKFTHDADWAPDNFGSGAEPGDLVLESGDPPHCIIEMAGPPGFYKIWMDDSQFRYSHELDLATGGIQGDLVFGGQEAPNTSIQLWADNEHGDAQLWTVEVEDGSYSIDNLADSLYTLVATATGYGTVSEQVRVSAGQVANFNFEFGDPLDSVEPDQPWATPIIDGTLEGDWTEIYDDGGHIGLWNLVNMDYNARHASWDADSLYLAVSGNFAGTYNSLNLYIDADYGTGSGLTDLSLIHGEDDYATIVNRLNKLVSFDAVPEFGAEFATSTWGHIDLALSSIASDGATVALGRGAIAASADALELSIPWSVLYPEIGGEGAVPPFAQIAVFALIGSNSDSAMSDDSLPLVDDLNTPDAVVIIPIDEDGE